MKINKITWLKSELDSIKEGFSAQKDFSGDELSRIAAKCGSIFLEIGVPEKLIDDVLTLFNINYLREDSISPFLRTLGSDKFQYMNQLRERLMPLWTAIEFAEMKLEVLEYDENIIPRWLLTELSEKKELGHVYSSLVSIDKAYTDRSAKDLETHTMSLLDSILSLEPSLAGKELSNKLTVLIEDKEGEVRSKFGNLSKDFFRGLNNSRLIRNTRVVHPTEQMKHDLPFIIGVTSTYLVITLLEATLSNGIGIANET